jgi:hypothetical protein
MSLHPKPLHSLAMPAPETGLTRPGLTPVPAWLRQAAQAEAQGLEKHGSGDKGLEDHGFAAGAAVALLDAVVRRDEKWGGAWRQRLALASAAVTAKRAGRVEDEAALRDAVLLTRPGDDVGPAGSFVLAWRRLATLPAETLLSPNNLAAAIGGLGLANAEELAADLAGELKRIAASGKPMFAAIIEALQLLQACGPGMERDFGPWLADAMAANALGWPRAVPLFGGQPGGRRPWLAVGENLAGREACRQQWFAGFARTALQAIDLSADLGRRADRLLAIAPKLRAKGADAVLDRLLADDAVVASQPVRSMSDRGLRRLFDRLVELGAVRELSGRPTFRLYGL